MRILLTGAEGFTGRHLAQRARAAGHEVVPLQADLRDAAQLRGSLEALEFDAVVHLAAISFVGHANPREFYDVNLFGTLNLLEALRGSAGPGCRVLLASSANVYGNCDRSPIPETQAAAPVNHYAMSKLAMEHLAAANWPVESLVITRPFNYTGRGQAGQFVIPKLVEHFRRGAAEIPLGNIDVQREYNDVRFACDAILQLLGNRQACGTYNLCTGVTHSLREVIGLLESLTGHRPRIVQDPALVRPNEILRLCGDPSRMRAACPQLADFTLAQTLTWMLEAA